MCLGPGCAAVGGLDGTVYCSHPRGSQGCVLMVIVSVGPCGCGDRVVFGDQWVTVFGADVGGDRGRPNLPLCCFSRQCSISPLLRRLRAVSPPGPPSNAVPPLPHPGWLFTCSLFLLLARSGPLPCAQHPTRTPPSGQAGLLMASALSLMLSQPWVMATPESRLAAAQGLGQTPKRFHSH